MLFIISPEFQMPQLFYTLFPKDPECGPELEWALVSNGSELIGNSWKNWISQLETS